MDIRSLRYFTETVRLGSFTEAGRTLGVSQSTISKMLRQLEDELGEPLLLRDARQLTLTDVGHVVYERGREILLAMQRLEDEVRETQSVARGALTLGMPPMINMLFTEALKEFRETHPRIVLRLDEHTGQEVERRVAAGELAAGMSVLPIDPQPDVEVVQVASHRVWAIGASGLLERSNDAVALRTVARMPLVLLNDDFALTRLLRRTFARYDIEADIAAQSGQWDWTVAMARAGMGVALLPEPFVQRIQADGLVLRPVTQPDIQWQIGLLWNARRSSHALRAWLEICRKRLGGTWPPLPE